MVELVTVMGVASCPEICGYRGYHDPPMLFVITDWSMTMLPFTPGTPLTTPLLTKKIALPYAFTWLDSMRVPQMDSVMTSPSL